MSSKQSKTLKGKKVVGLSLIFKAKTRQTKYKSTNLVASSSHRALPLGWIEHVKIQIVVSDKDSTTK